ncbi:hypothetical protein ZIOFF_037685 [Zingiber officinale]|uniref:Cation/H+ exchanger transmembrane domain-containing protein n=1 Tax=Zingiber officinale TaxID=94328 RepID=A0A8J5L9X0_ZINOF|nr:hypothetical protein ZIOFF_037685 [Zingiber officinale]
MAVDLSSLAMKLGISRLGTSDHASVVSINIFVALICACIVIGHLLEENRWMNESITSLIIGLCTGAVIRLLTQGKNSHIMVFSEDLFFIYVLPPIIFNAGFISFSAGFNAILFLQFCPYQRIDVVEEFRNSFNKLENESKECTLAFLKKLFAPTTLTTWGLPSCAALDVCKGPGKIPRRQYSSVFLVCSLEGNVSGEGKKMRVAKAIAIIPRVRPIFSFIKWVEVFHIGRPSGADDVTASAMLVQEPSLTLDVVTRPQPFIKDVPIMNDCVGAIEFFRKMNIGELDIGDYLAIGAIFSATDSVCTLQVLNQDETPLLYSLVFGEGVVNDATSVVLFNAIQKFDLVHVDFTVVLQFVANFFYLFLASTLLGAVAGLLSAYIIKQLYFGRHSTDREVALMILMAYLSYMLAELLDFSGILTVFFCGIVMSHYTWHNVTESSRVTTKHAFATLSFIAEIFLFLYVGTDALDIEKWKFVSDSPGKSIGVSSILLGLFTKSGHTQQRGNAFMITSTITVVLFSTMVFGFMTKPLIYFLLPPSSKHLTRSLSVSSEPSSPKSFLVHLLDNGQGSEVETVQPVPRPTSLRMLLTVPSRSVHHYWRKFDDAFMRPMFGGRGFVPFVPGSPVERTVNAWE